MKNILILFATAIITLQSHGQDVKNADFISPFNEGLAAVQKGNTWGFINNIGALVIDFREDLVALPSEEYPKVKFPKFVQSRALIQETRDDIIYYGFINGQGHTVIEPVFINQVQFNKDGLTIIQRLIKDTYGTNKIMKKNMVRYSYTEDVINLNGATIAYLTEPKHILPYQDSMKESPRVESILLSKEWVAAHNRDNTYTLTSLKQKK